MGRAAWWLRCSASPPGAFIFAVARDFTMLSVGRALIGLGVSAGLMGAIKAFTLWFPLSRLALLNGLYLAAGGIGGLSATAPAQALIEPLGWRGLFYVLSGLSVAAALLVFFVVPEKRLPGHGAVSIFVDDVDALHADLVKRGARVLKAPKDYDYGLRDFDVADLDGNMIFFGMESKKAS